MQIRTWFGVFTLDDDGISGVELSGKDMDAILELNSSNQLLQRGNIAGKDLRDLAIRYGFVSSIEEYDAMLHDLNVRLAERQVEQAVTPDRKIIAAVEAIDDIDGTANILSGRLREWYMLIYGETDLKGRELASRIKGTGSPSSPGMHEMASSLLSLYDSRRSIEEYLKDSMQGTAPNLTNVAGYLLGARLLCIAGSLEKLASMPSSTIQVIGAGNALFKHLKGKAPSPKHGLIFRHPYVNTAPKRLRGKIARAVSSKISLAARCDLYSGKVYEGLPSELENKVANIRKIPKNRS